MGVSKCKDRRNMRMNRFKLKDKGLKMKVEFLCKDRAAAGVIRTGRPMLL